MFTCLITGQRCPVLIWVHGGGWQRGDKDHVGSKASFFTKQGFLFVSVDYRLSPKVVHPAHVQDVAAATAWTYRHCAEYGGDPNRLFIMGHSAGAHLVALTATDERYLQAEGVSLSILKGCIPLDGAGYDISAEIARGRRLAVDMFENAFGKDPAVWKEASPINHIAAGKSIPPFLLIHAGIRAASREESHAMADLMSKVGIPATVKHAQDKNHMTVNRELGEPGDEPTQWILAFLKGLL